MGFVYLLKSRCGTQFKIGVSQDEVTLRWRLSALGGGAVIDLASSLLFACEEPYMTEAALHAIFTKFRVKPEHAFITAPGRTECFYVEVLEDAAQAIESFKHGKAVPFIELSEALTAGRSVLSDEDEAAQLSGPVGTHNRQAAENFQAMLDRMRHSFAIVRFSHERSRWLGFEGNPGAEILGRWNMTIQVAHRDGRHRGSAIGYRVDDEERGFGFFAISRVLWSGMRVPYRELFLSALATVPERDLGASPSMHESFVRCGLDRWQGKHLHGLTDADVTRFGLLSPDAAEFMF